MNFSEVEKEIEEQRKRGIPPYHDFPRIPVTDKSLLHQKLLIKLQEKDVPEEEIESKFAEFAPTISAIIERQEKRGLIRRYEKDGRAYLSITKEGKKRLMFSQGLDVLRRER